MCVEGTILRVPDIVLIETYWNVNEEQKEWLKFLHTVLIETYWNVNTTRKRWYAIFRRY